MKLPMRLHIFILVGFFEHVLMVLMLMVRVVLMVWVVLMVNIVLMVLILAGQEGQVALRALVGIMAFGTTFEAGDLFQGLMSNSLQPLGVDFLGVISRFDIAKCTVSCLFLSLSCFSLL